MGDFTEVEAVFFEQFMAGFEPSNVTIKHVNKFQPAAKVVERAGQTIRRPYPYQVDSVDGLDISGSFGGLTELTCPVSLSEADIKNVPFQLGAAERNDKMKLKEAAQGAAIQLSSKFDTDVQNTVANYGSVVLTETGMFSDYDQLSKADTAFSEREVPMVSERSMVLNPRAANAQAAKIAGRETFSGKPLTVYERATVNPVAGFDTFKANVIQNLAGSSATGITISGANQNVTPVAFKSSGTLAPGEVNDPRYSTLTVNLAGLVVGDCFHIAGVNAIGMISKKDTGTPQTFRVVAASGADLIVTPAIIPADGTDAQKRYATVTTTPANGAAVTILNTASTQPSIFFTKPAVEIFVGELDTDQLEGSMPIMSETTDSGIHIIFARQGDINDLSAKYRLTAWGKTHVLQPQQCGIMLPNQAASFG
jgi:hypothetical protein